MNRCGPEKKDTKEHGRMLRTIPKPAEGEVPDRNAKGWKVEGEIRRGTMKECKILRE